MKPVNILCGAVVLMATCGLASATSCIDTCVTYSAATPTTEADFFGSAYSAPFSSSEYINLPSFDPSLGTLQSVSITLSANSGANTDPTDYYSLGTTSGFYVDDTGYNNSTSFSQAMAMQVYLLDPTSPACLTGITTPGSEASAPCLLAGLTNSTPGANLSYSDTTPTIPAGGTYATPVSLGATVTTTVSSVLQADFIGAGSLALPVYAETQLSIVNNTGNGIDSSSLFAGVSASITYDYIPSDITASPEPASVVLMGIALTSLGLVRRRFASRS